MCASLCTAGGELYFRLVGGSGTAVPLLTGVAAPRVPARGGGGAL